MINVNFRAYASYVTDSLYQWDINQKLSVSGLNLSVAPEVHFSNANTDRAIVKQATLDNHIVTVDIPNSLLQMPLTIKAHIGIYESDTFKVIEKVEIPVIARKRPSDYQIEDSDEEIYSFKALENALNNKADNARVDNIIAHNNNTNDNTELVDIRVGADGKTYASAGSAIREQIKNLAVPKHLSVEKWSNAPLEKQAFTYCDVHNGNSIVELMEYSASFICGKGNLKSIDNIGSYVMKRGRLLNEISLDIDLNDYSVIINTDVAFRGRVYLMATDFSGTYPYLASDEIEIKKGWNVIDFTSKRNGTSATNYGYRFVAIRILPPNQTTVELLNNIQFSIIKNLKSILDDYLEKNKTIFDKIPYDFVAWGDSLTQGSGGNGTTYLKVVADKFGGTYYNGGQGGENPSLIACRAGANSIYIPANQSPNIAFNAEFDFGGGNLYTASTSARIPVTINGESYTLVRNSDGLYYIESLTEATEYPRAITINEQYNKGKVTIIWIGTNSDRTYESIYPYIDRIIETLPNRNYIVMGLTYNSDVSLLETTNSELKKRYGNKFLDIRELILRYGLDRSDIYPTIEDTTAINVGLIPPSLLSDNVHFNETGYTLIGNFIIDKIYSLGYDKLL